jgi:hypothetical protein
MMIKIKFSSSLKTARRRIRSDAGGNKSKDFVARRPVAQMKAHGKH